MASPSHPSTSASSSGSLTIGRRSRYSVELASSVERSPEATLVWQLAEPPGFGFPAITSQTWEEPEDCIWVGNTLNLSLRIDHRRRLVSVAAKDGNLQVTLEALASIALPLVAQQSGSLVLHGAAACIDGSATLLCGEGGCGKSSLLMGLAHAGWLALSEDQCVVDIAPDGRHRVWPGPRWARLKHGSLRPPLVEETAPRFEAADKVAWDLGERVARAPAVPSRVVLLEPPGGNEPVWEPLPERDAIGALASHATWFRRPDDFAAAVLPQVVKLGMSVPAFRMRVPWRPDWLEHAVALLEER